MPPTVTLEHRDFLDDTCRLLSAAEVPPVPDDGVVAERRGSVVIDKGNERWRTCGGVVYRYFRYKSRGVVPDGCAWSEAYLGG